MKNSLIASGCIINGVVENSVLFKDVFVGNNCVIKNSVILNDMCIWGIIRTLRIALLRAGIPFGQILTIAEKAKLKIARGR